MNAGGIVTFSYTSHFTTTEKAVDIHWEVGWVGLIACVQALQKIKISYPSQELNN